MGVCVRSLTIELDEDDDSSRQAKRWVGNDKANTMLAEKSSMPASGG